MDSDMQGGPVDELLGMAVERPALDQLEVEVGRTGEDRVQPDDRYGRSGGVAREDDVFRAGRLAAVAGDRVEGERARE